jgi:MFS family permease
MTPASPAPGPTYLRIILSVFLPFAGGYYISYFFRSVNAIIAPDLVADIGLTAADLGLLTAAYFFAFALFQLPLGILLDRFGPAKVQTVLLLTAALGAFVFAAGDAKSTLFIGRALIGLGVAGGLMSSFKAIVLWFPRDRLPLINSVFMAFGGLGALSATAPVESAMAFTDWRGVYAAIGVVTALVALLILVVTPEKPRTAPVETVAELIKSLAAIYTDRVFWRIAPITVCAAGAAMALQGLWSGPWLKDVAGASRTEVASHLFVIALCMTIGFALQGLISDFVYRRWRIQPQTVMATGVIIFLAIQFGIIFELTWLSYVIWGAFGLLSNFAALGFAVLSQHFPQSLSARANSAMNVLVFLFAFGSQYAVGPIINTYPLTDAGGYQPQAFQVAFAAIAAIQVLAVGWYFLSGRRR